MNRALLGILVGLLLPSPASTAQERCPLAAIGAATVASVRDGRTLLLADGRELRLAAI